MLFFMGYSPSEGNWTGHFTNAVRRELVRRGIPFKEIPPYDWYASDVPLDKIKNIDSRQGDVWLISWAQSPIVDLIRDKPGRKYGFVVGLTAMPFEPAVLVEAAGPLREGYRLSLYDGIFANSEWCMKCLCRSYPVLAERVSVTGFPFDFEVYEQYGTISKDDKLVAFNQRFALEKLHVIELEVARRLISAGYRVRHLSGVEPAVLSAQDPSVSSLLDIAGEIGVEFVYNPTKEQYHQKLAEASVVVTTSIADMLPSSMVEAIHLGAVPVAPAFMCFPEFIHRDNLYTPYDLQEIVSIAEKRPYRQHRIDKFRSRAVMDRMLGEMPL